MWLPDFNWAKWALRHMFVLECFLVKSWCLSSVTAFWVCARSFQEGQVKVSPKSYCWTGLCQRIGLLSPGLVGFLCCTPVLSGWCWRVWRLLSGSLFLECVWKWGVGICPWRVFNKACLWGLAAWRCMRMWRGTWGYWGWNAVPPLSLKRCLLAGALGCADALCFVGRCRPAVGSIQHSFCVRTFPHGSISCSSIVLQ